MIGAAAGEVKPVAARAWWSGGIGDLLAETPEAVVGQLAVRLVETHPANRAEQLMAWRRQVAVLAEVLASLPEPLRWRLLLEYPLLRLGRRIDAVLLSDRAIIVLEFKVGAREFAATAREQVEDYALDLLDFHAGSRGHPVIPVLVATDAPAVGSAWPLFWHGVTPVLDASAASLGAVLLAIDRRVGDPRGPLDVGGWEAAPYRPVPTIVDAATMLFNRHGVEEIAAARADVDSLGRTTTAIREIVARAQANSRHAVVFVTGIPGAGKTFCGLKIVFGAELGAAFLTGNLPVVNVLREALARDAALSGQSLRMARQQTESAIQPLLGFLRDNVARADPPHEHVIVFDEAQRAWDAAFGRQRFGLDDSEAALFLDIMRRHADHAVIVALVGNGQEINTGEAGLAEWGRALAARPDWDIYAAPQALAADDPRQLLFAAPSARVVSEPALHLAVPIRSVRSSQAAPWVDAVLKGDAVAARAIADAAAGVPFLVTRSLNDLRAGLRRLARGQRRAGLVCSAGAKRLRADGLWPEFPHLDDKAVADWFLNRWPDVRASDALEMPATQFACQGLELDLVGLCWGGDLVRRAGRPAWVTRAFSGTRWTEPRGEDRQSHRLNTYRVLLTRARYETVIWVPDGDAADRTRRPAEFDAIAAYLLACGATVLGHSPNVEMAEEAAMPALAL